VNTYKIIALEEAIIALQDYSINEHKRAIASPSKEHYSIIQANRGIYAAIEILKRQIKELKNKQNEKEGK